ncbi:MAG: TonB-dependent receptor, partial [Verrucomicrobiaceae bacterium]|nr:TonB-dependent receptor [Verrucomicrobiaceae bacterium]
RSNQHDVGTLTVIDATIYTTSLFRLRAGGVGLAFGGQFQHETVSQGPDETRITLDLLGGPGFFPAEGERDVYAGYAELSVPVFGGEFTAPGFHALEFTAAVRYEEFSNTGQNVMVPKVGMRWQPLDDSLTIRATAGHGFKQPTLVELYAPDRGGPTDVFDPVTGQVASGVAVTILQNQNLQAEDSRNFSAGIVYSPKFVPGLTLTVDIFNIETSGYIDPLANPSDVLRRVAEGNPLPNETATRDADGDLIAFTYSLYNGGTQKARGLDFSAFYQLATAFGTFTSLTQATLLDSFQFSSAPGETERELRSQPIPYFSATDFFSSRDAYLKWRGTSRLDWSWKGLSLAATAIYRDGFHEFLPNGNEHWVRQTWFFDLQGSYSFEPASNGGSNSARSVQPGWKRLAAGTTFTLGVRNVFDRDPPEAVGNYPRFIYDPTGRFVYFSLTKKF